MVPWRRPGDVLADSPSALTEILERRVGERGSAALAGVWGDPPRLSLAFLPRAPGEEPAFLAYSVTKTFLAALVLRLREEGCLSLDEPLARWFPRVPSAGRITLRTLLSHTAGIPDYGGLAAYHRAVRESPGRPWSFERFAAETWERGLLGEPGGPFTYSNPGYMLVRAVAELAGGASFAELIRRCVTEPLGLPRTRVVETLADLAALAPAPSSLLSDDGTARDVRRHYHPGWVSHGVLASTASEIARFLHALFGGSLVSRASLAEMTARVPVRSAPPRWVEPSYGLGLMIDPASPWGAIHGHMGGGPGYQSCAFHARAAAGGPASVCGMVAFEDPLLAEGVVFDTLDRLRGA